MEGACSRQTYCVAGLFFAAFLTALLMAMFVALLTLHFKWQNNEVFEAVADRTESVVRRLKYKVPST